MITPLAPLLPYIEVAPASLSTDNDSISLGLILLKLSEFKGTPSITYRGSILPLIDP
ncbi:hypothetical protein D3C71_2238200 [compost metagenome]